MCIFMHLRKRQTHFSGLCVFDLTHIFIADLSMIHNLNAKLIISTLEMEEPAFHKP